MRAPNISLDHCNEVNEEITGILPNVFEKKEKEEMNEYLVKHIDFTCKVPFMTWPRPNIRNYMGPDVVFPSPKDININMMPILLGSGVFTSLPDFCKQYRDMIWKHCFSPICVEDEKGGYRHKVGYLTIHEGLVPVGEYQRRPGVHIERPGSIKVGGHWLDRYTQEYRNIAWGLGCWGEDGLPSDGIYMASSVDNSCAIWPVVIDRPEEVTDKHGGIEHMRQLLGQPRLLKANEMCWFTDRTPHESLPLKAPTTEPNAKFVYRQFFRLVVGPISVWYTKHNTANPLGIKPDAVISEEDKFE